MFYVLYSQVIKYVFCGSYFIIEYTPGLINVLLALPLSGNGSFSTFRVNAVFGWMPCHNSQQKMNIFMCLATSCGAVFAVTTASLFPDFCFTVSNEASMSNLTSVKKRKKAFAFLFEIPVCICCCFAMTILHSF